MRVFVSNTKVFRPCLVALAQDTVDVLESPADGSRVKVTYMRGVKFTLAGAVRGETQWVEVRTNSGDVGFIRAETKVKEIADSQAASDQNGQSSTRSFQFPAQQTTSNYANSFAKYGGWAGFVAMFGFPRAGGPLGLFIVGAVVGGAGAGLGMALGSFFDAAGAKPTSPEGLPDHRGLSVAALILGIIGLVAWVIPPVGAAITTTGFCLVGRLDFHPSVALH
jgi:hypothetical protein